jgi:hypothetical protein
MSIKTLDTVNDACPMHPRTLGDLRSGESLPCSADHPVLLRILWQTLS